MVYSGEKSTQRSKSFKIFPKVSKIEGEIPKTQEKNTKLKEETQALGGFHPRLRPSDVIKSLY